MWYVATGYEKISSDICLYVSGLKPGRIHRGKNPKTDLILPKNSSTPESYRINPQACIMINCAYRLTRLVWSSSMCHCQSTMNNRLNLKTSVVLKQQCCKRGYCKKWPYGLRSFYLCCATMHAELWALLHWSSTQGCLSIRNYKHLLKWSGWYYCMYCDLVTNLPCYTDYSAPSTVRWC